jgi:Concanavalin A-like lectin/glucanases superfamily
LSAVKQLVALLAVAIALLATAAASAAEPAPLGSWRLDEPDGQIAADDGVHGLDGRLGATDGPDGSDPLRIEGAVGGGALRFGGGAYVRLPDAPELALATLTVEAVARAATSPGKHRYLVSRGSHDCFAGSYGLYTGEAGGIGMYVYDGSRYVVSPVARPADVWNGEWHHVAGTFDGRSVRLYVDGRPVGTPREVPLQIDYAGTTATAAFGRYVGSCDLSYIGDLDAVRIRSGALDAGAAAAAAHAALRPGERMPLGPQPGLPAATPTEILSAAPPPAARPVAAPGAPQRACSLRLSRTRIAARRRTVVRARVTLRGRPAPAVQIVARRQGRKKPITRARTGAGGRVRLVIRVRRPGRVRISVAIRPSCAPVVVRVARPRS